MFNYLGRIFLALCLGQGSIVWAQCPIVTVENPEYTHTVDDFTDFLVDPIIYGATYINIDATADCTWDLGTRVVSFTPTYYTATPLLQGNFGIENIDIRAVNDCQTADQDYFIDGSADCLTDGSRICNDFWAEALFAAAPPPIRPSPLTFPFNYIVGTVGIEGADLAKNIAPCNAIPVALINDQGSGDVNTTTHRFRLDFKLDFSQFIFGANPNRVVTPGLYTLVLEVVSTLDDGTQPLSDFFTLNIDIPPLLQLNMKTEDEVDFNFTDITQYQSGIVKYGATILEVSSNMNWDLYAIGTSTINEAGGGQFWDNLATYSASGTNQIPLTALEVHQSPINPVGLPDYSSVFVNPPVGANNIEAAAGGLAGVVVGAKSIAGRRDGLAGGNSMPPGSFLSQNGVTWTNNDYRYVISYKLTPGLPAVFGNGIPAMGNFATPGVYGMQVKYLITEDQ
ncbi:hypothetical protein N9R81_01505 [Flavobacteriales bacterium]|nr:hypothetical protein [Flavobacteriales bacterium]